MEWHRKAVFYMAGQTDNQPKRIRNLFDSNTGLPIMINLYVIKYVYYHIKKADCFIEEKGEGRKPRAYPIYGNWLPVSRQRFDRINRGERFEISNREAAEICSRFGIDIKHFRRDNPVAFEIEGLSDADWKCFYNENYDGHYRLANGTDSVAGAKKVGAALKTLLSPDWERRLDRDGPLFKICHYFHYGKRSDKPDSKKVLKEALGQIGYREWEGETVESLEEFHSLLKKHCDYIDSLITIRNLRNEK